MKIDILTTNPKFYKEIVKHKTFERLISQDKLELRINELKSYSNHPRKRVDEPPIGGGGGMILTIEPVVNGIKSLSQRETKIIYFSPRGKLLKQNDLEILKNTNHLLLIAGNYEGIDERILDYVDLHYSIGDYVLNSGDIASWVFMDGLVRLIDGSINQKSLETESFNRSLLEHPHYCKPIQYDGKKVPQILYSGNHKEIERWKKTQSLKYTLLNRPDLLEKCELNNEEKQILKQIKKEIKSNDT